jgi:rRNA maturation protein Rpf1
MGQIKVQLSVNEVIDVANSMHRWSDDLVRRDAYPILVIGMSKAKPEELVVYKGGEYSNDQIRALLDGLIRSMPGDDQNSPIIQMP